MHLRSIAIKGFKSFPTRTRLEFGPGVSVIVGPNGSGKSNIADAVLWALGEQSALAVRGQTMRDVIFAGGHGVAGSTAAEVEVVIDNQPGDGDDSSPARPGEGGLRTDFAELSIVRRLQLDGEGEYRLNGARCRLVDVLEVLSDSGLGKEMHSVVSQGKVEQIVLSRPRDRRLMIEEAAGLGKHRKRRRRAQLKLERTSENLARALDVEREARSHLRPLKRQAEAAELHERLERQSLEARLALVASAARTAKVALADAEGRARGARGERDEAERLLADVARRREEAEGAFAAHSRERERLQETLFGARAAAERIAMRLERAQEQGRVAEERARRRQHRLELLGRQAEAQPDPPAERISALERELERLERSREERRRRELEGLEAELANKRERLESLEEALAEGRRALGATESAVEEARAARRRAESAAEAARSRAARIGAELAAVERLVRAAGFAPAGARTLAEGLRAEAGYEAALAAALGARMAAAVVDDLPAGERLLDASGDDGATALVSSRAHGRPVGHAPGPGARRLVAHVRPEAGLARLAERLLGDVWVVASLDSISASFRGVAVTRSGRILDASSGELSQAPAGGAEALLERLARREELATANEGAAAEESDTRAALERAAQRVSEAEAGREEAEVAVRLAAREAGELADVVERAEWLLEQRRGAPHEGSEAGAELAAELEAERGRARRIDRDRAERERSLEALRTGAERDAELAAAARRATRALQSARVAVETRRDVVGSEFEAGAAVGEQTAATLRACAHEEAQLQGTLRRASEAVTATEVAAQQARDAAAEVERELTEIAARLALEPKAADAPLPAEEREALEARIERLRRRREQLGPVNPLAGREYEEAVAHVEELESQRRDLEGALAELENLIKETDRRIRESFEQTFAAAAHNFEDVVQHLFPGGRGRLRLVQAEQVPRPVVGGGAAEEEPPDEEQPEAGVEIEVTPPGKATKRLSLLSGGEKALVALAFMFAVFLARPCPFYVLDEVEAALDDVNIDRFLELLRRYADRAQFIVVTHQKRTMDAADTLYGVSMGGDGVSRVVSRKLAGKPVDEAAA
jgi:chromosome segregation protein